MTDPKGRDTHRDPMPVDDAWSTPPEPAFRRASTKSVAPEVPRARDQRAQPTEPKSPDWLDALLAEVATTDLRRASGGEPEGEVALRASMARASYDEPSVAGAESETSTSGKRCDVGLCTFWIGPRCFALDIRLVGEVVHVDRVVELPLTPPAFVGMFNLRGTPLPLVDLAKVLHLRGRAEVDTSEGRTLLALVLRFSGITVGALIDRMQAVVPPGKEHLVRAEEGDNPLVQGFLAGRRGAKDTVTVLDADALEARFNDLKFSSRSDETIH